MAPKAKPKARGKDAPKLNVPPPPPAPVCIQLPEAMLERNASERCLLLAYADPENKYKVQIRSFTPGETLPASGASAEFCSEEESREAGWIDAKETERVALPNRHHHEARLISCEYVRLQYRLVLTSGPQSIDGNYVANWQSVPSEPVASYVDPPVELAAEFCYDSDQLPPSVELSWRSSNMEWLRAAMGSDGVVQAQTHDGYGPFAAWPGLMPTKVQVRWRVVHELSNGEALPKELAGGGHFISAAVDGITKDGTFNFREDTWKLTYREVMCGVVVRFSVRIGTAFRWSPWSSETGDFIVEIPEPTPLGMATRGDRSLKQKNNNENECAEARELSQDIDSSRSLVCIETKRVDASSVEVAWPAFTTKGMLSWVEYRVMVCMIAHATDTPAFEQSGIIASTFMLEKQPTQVSSVIRGLFPNKWYVVRVDARYPHIGKRSFSLSSAVSAPFRTPFPPRPPLQPLPVAMVTRDHQDIAGFRVSGPDCSSHHGDVQAEEHATAENINWSAIPWVALCVEKASLQDHIIEYNAAPSTGSGEEYYHGWQAPVAVQIADGESELPPASCLRCVEHENVEDSWQVVRVALQSDAPELVVCRLVRREGHVGTEMQSSSVPLVAFIAPVTFAATPIWTDVSDNGVRLVARFFLHPGTTGVDAQLQPRPKRGHRFVTRYQVRFRCMVTTRAAEARDGVEEFGAAQWVTFEPTLLPPACPRHTASRSVAVLDRTEATEEIAGADEQQLEDLRERLGWRGARYEVRIDPGAESLRALLHDGSPFEVNVRVGSDHRWSEWASPFDTPRVLDSLIGNAPLSSAVTTAAPSAAGDQQLLNCTPCSATRLRLSWAPFDRPPGITVLEYVVRAKPLFNDGASPVGLEGVDAVERVYLFKHCPRSSDDELLQTREAQRVLEESEEVPLRKLLGLLQARRESEREADREAGRLAQVDLPGLLPCTRYSVSVSARFPAAKAMMFVCTQGFGGLTEEIETPGGEAAPAAPQALLPGSLPCDEIVPPYVRSVLLRLEHRSGYVLEYRAAAASSAHFNAQSSSARMVFGGNWQQDDGASLAGTWHRVTSVDVLDSRGCSSKSDDVGNESVVVRADLPGFEGEAPLPDAVEFRLCTEARSATHPCRWVGAISESIAVCFAPPRQPPRIQRVLSDDRWCLSLTLELFKSASAPSPQKLLASSLLDGDDSDEDGDHDRELADLRRMQTLPLPPEESWAIEADLGRIPVGYGHRMVSSVQFRYSLQSGLTAALQMQLEEKSLSRRWQVAPPMPISSASFSGARCTVDICSSIGLLDDGIYMFQVRVGDGIRWSAWSHTSNAYTYRVPPPTLPTLASIGKQQAVMVEPVSSTVARVRWCDFRPAPGLTLLEYEVRATPLQTQDGIPVTTHFEHRYRGGFIEREVTNLVPGTTYIFSVQARYPRVGSRHWAGKQQSDPMVFEHPLASQDPPAPIVVPDIEEHDGFDDDPTNEGSGTQCCATLEFPDEEDGVQYDLEYAHVLGDEVDTSELRGNQFAWQTPVEIKLLDETDGGVQHLPRWRVQLHPLQNHARADLVKLALMQRVRFRLRRRQTPEVTSMRWWSALSAPICTGFAGPDAALSALAAVADRLALELHFSLDRRIADAAITVGLDGLRDARAELVKASKHSDITESSIVTGGRLQGTSPLGVVSGSSWPRGFAHAFVTRYQLRVRAQAHVGVAGNSGHFEWGPWEVYPDSALPKEVDRSMRLGGWFAGSVGSVRTGNSQARWYAVEVPQGKNIVLQDGVAVQVAIRVGDGIKWSSWRSTKEIVVSVQPPRPARDGDAARAEWFGNTCIVSWPPASAPLGLDSIEYQLVVEPDSARLPPRIGAMLVAPAAHIRRDSDGQSGEAQPALRVPPRTRGAVPSSVLHSDSQLAGSAGGVRGSGAGGKQTLTPTTLAGRGARASGLLASEEHDHFRAEQANIVVELHALCPEFRHGFTVLARYPTVGPRAFTRVFEVPKTAQKPLPSPAAPWTPTARGLEQGFAATAAAPAAGASSTSPVAAASAIRPPRPEQVAILGDLPQLRRWVGDGRGKVVLLTWQGLESPPDGGAGCPLSTSLEVQVASVPLIRAGHGAANRDVRNGLDCTDEAGHLAWQPCGITTFISLQGRRCAVIQDPPCPVQHIRLVDPVGLRAGPPSMPMVAFYEHLPSAPAVELELLGKRAPRAAAVRIGFPLGTAESTLRWATRYQVRFQAVGASDEEDAWEELEPSALESGGRDQVSALVREEDGLELSYCYKFEVRLGDVYRLGPWSLSSRALQFAFAPPVPPEDAGIKVCSDTTQAKLSWPPFKPQAALASKFPGLSALPVEYSVVVHSGAQRELVASLVTRETSVTIRPLSPSTSYSAHLEARWTRFGFPSPSGDGCNYLSAAFITASPAQQLVIDASPRYSHGSTCAPGVDVATPNNIAGAGGRVPANSQKCVARPALPQLVPLPPPKFAARDPLTYALLSPQEPASARPSSVPRRRWHPGALPPH